MWTVDDKGEKSEWQTVWTSGNDPVKGISALFVKRASDGTALYSILSEMHYLYTPGGDRLVEHVKGKTGDRISPRRAGPRYSPGHSEISGGGAARAVSPRRCGRGG